MKTMISIPAIFFVFFAVGILPLPGFFFSASPTSVALAMFHCDIIARERVPVFTNELSTEPSTATNSPFLRTILHVRFLIAEKQMRRIATRRVIAAVTHVKVVERAKGKQPS